MPAARSTRSASNTAAACSPAAALPSSILPPDAQARTAMPEVSFPRRALVTGGSGELGGAICHALAAAGWHVLVHGHHSLARAEETAAAIVAAGGSAQALAFDVTDAEVSRAALDRSE